MLTPHPRGPVSTALVATLRGRVERGFSPTPLTPLSDPDRPADDALALWILHELHYRGFDDVDDGWEWAPALMPLRQRLEHDLERRLRRRFDRVDLDLDGPLLEVVGRIVDADDGPSLARRVQRDATRSQALHLLRQRSIYHLKEADPTSWVVPRLSGDVKAALMSVQFDEYGAGRAENLHQDMFGTGMAAAGLDARYGAYIDEAETSVLEQNNAMSLFGLHRRLRGAAIGHFAAVEATSSLPSRQIAQGLGRLGFPAAMIAYYDEHVEADAVHEQVVLRDVCEPLVAGEPRLRTDLLFGVWTCLDLEGRTATAIMSSWEAA